MVVDDDHVGAAAAATASGSKLVVPQSTVTISWAPSSTSVVDGRRVRPVALDDAVGDVDAGVEPVAREEALHQRRRAGAVDVVVAEHGDALALDDGIGEARGGRVHVAAAWPGPASAP